MSGVFPALDAVELGLDLIFLIAQVTLGVSNAV